MKQSNHINVGTFRVGMTRVTLVAKPGEMGGNFDMLPSGGAFLPRIEVGLKADHFDEVVAWLLHETLELAMCQNKLRFNHSSKLNYDSADFHFHFNHPEFGRICSEAAMFLAEAAPKMAALYSKHKRK